MTTKIDVFIQNKNWKKYIRNPKRHLEKNFRYAQANIKEIENRNINLTILLAGNKEIKILNKRFRNKNRHTDVLSFPFNKKQKKLKENYLGDIIISFNYMNKPKNLDNYEFKIKTIKIFIHGFLHLLGHDHQKNKEYKQMLNEEKKIFKSIEKTSILN